MEVDVLREQGAQLEPRQGGDRGRGRGRAMGRGGNENMVCLKVKVGPYDSNVLLQQQQHYDGSLNKIQSATHACSMLHCTASSSKGEKEGTSIL